MKEQRIENRQDKVTLQNKVIKVAGQWQDCISFSCMQLSSYRSNLHKTHGRDDSTLLYDVVHKPGIVGTCFINSTSPCILVLGGHAVLHASDFILRRRVMNGASVMDGQAASPPTCPRLRPAKPSGRSEGQVTFLWLHGDKW